MPFIRTHFTGTITPAQEAALKEGFGKAIALLPGKTQRWLMVEFADNCRIWFQGGNEAPLAMVEVSVFGSSTDAAYEKLTAEITRLLTGELNLKPENIYVKYAETSHWGWNGGNF